MEMSCSPDDLVFLEDESGKVEIDLRSRFDNPLKMSLSIHSFNTGNFVRIKGRMQSNYKFLAEEIFFLHDHQENSTGLNESLKLLFISGLNLTKESITQKSAHNLRNFFLFGDKKLLN